MLRVMRWETVDQAPGTPRESGKDIFETFFRLRGSPRGDFFSDLFGVLGPEGPRDPCKWSTGYQVMRLPNKNTLELVFIRS